MKSSKIKRENTRNKRLQGIEKIIEDDRFNNCREEITSLLMKAKEGAKSNKNMAVVSCEEETRKAFDSPLKTCYSKSFPENFECVERLRMKFFNSSRGCNSSHFEKLNDRIAELDVSDTLSENHNEPGCDDHLAKVREMFNEKCSASRSKNSCIEEISLELGSKNSDCSSEREDLLDSFKGS